MQYKIKLTFTEDLLGTVAMDKDVYSSFIAAKAEELGQAQEAQELSTIIEKLDQKGKTGFHRLPDGTPMLYDYVIKGFLKSACGFLRRIDGSRSKKLTAYKKVIDGLVFPAPRQIPITAVGDIGELQRPLRAQTAQGERVALSFSESIPAGSSMAFTVTVLDDKGVPRELLEDWLGYGALLGLGQWRSGGYGRFAYEIA